jgi:hypothetical protein
MIVAKDKNQRLSSNPVAMKILEECSKQGLSDKDIQKRLIVECGYKWTTDTIGRRRRAVGITKKPEQRGTVDTPGGPFLTNAPHGLSVTEKAIWFRDQFKKTHLYTTIKRQLESDEVSTYLEDFGLLCCQFEDIVISEFMQIDDFLKHRILVNRQLILSRSIAKEIYDLQMWFVQHPKLEDEAKDDKKNRVMQQRILENKHKYLEESNKRYDSLIKERQKIYDSLAATRKDRLDELRGGKETFLELVAKMQHSQDERDSQGRFAELTKIASEDVKTAFRQPVKFPDGQVDPIIMDEHTDFGEDNDE